MKTKLCVLLLLAGSTLFARVHVSFGIGFGGWNYYAPPAPVVAYTPVPEPVYYTAQPVCYRHYRYRTTYWVRRPYYRTYYRTTYYSAPRYYSYRYARRHYCR